MKILYISYDGMTDPLGQSQVIPYLQGLVGCNHEIHLISCEKPDRMETNGARIAELLSGKGIIWHPQKYTSRPPVVSTIMDVLRMKRRAKKIIKQHSISIVHCRSYIAALVGLWAQRQFAVSFVFDMRGFWADERVEGGLWNLSNPLYRFVYRFFKKKEREFLSKADWVVSLTEEARLEILKWHKGAQSPAIAVIPCCVDLDHFSPSSVSEDSKILLRKELNIAPNALIISYLGSVGTWYLLDEMLHFFECLQKKHSNAVFLFVTAEGNELIRQHAAKYNILDGSIVVRSAARKDVPLYVSISQASIFFIKQSFSKKASSPTKMGELMAMGIPLICNDGVGDVGFIMKTSNAGLLLPACNEAEYEHALRSFDDFLKLDKEHIKEAARHHFSLDAGIAMYNEIYTAIGEKNNYFTV